MERATTHRETQGGGRLLMGTLVGAMLLALLAGGQSADAGPKDVVKDHGGLAFGYYTDVRFFGGPSVRLGYGQTDGAPFAPASDDTASPAAECPEDSGSLTESDPDSTWDADSEPGDGSIAQYGPAVIFGGIWPEASSAAPPSGPMTASIDCQRGVKGHVTASSEVTLMPEGSTWDPPPPGGSLAPHPGGVGPGPFVADSVSSTCTMTTSGVDGEVTIDDGTVATHAQATDHDQGIVQVATHPESNTVIDGHLHLGFATDFFRVTLNEQIHNGDGSFTVNAVHVVLNVEEPPAEQGHLVIGSSTCGPLSTPPGGSGAHGG